MNRATRMAMRRVRIVPLVPAALPESIAPGPGPDRDLVRDLVRQGLAHAMVTISRELPHFQPSGKFRQVYRQETP